ncbi:hypothetical protein [Allorhizocola rhizosphaerae]|uniref:hypothetical protein n=1 Tax=Allorhizocola rhizosphaerae TaxID=1872709 RepID=UPI0013C2DE17|nr:hypothetical protein [Allorhizocola rhizosphaerae]
MTTQKIFADRPSRVENMTGLTCDQVDRLVLDVYAAGDLVSAIMKFPRLGGFALT